MYLQIKDLNIIFDDFTIKNFSLSLAKETFFVLLGPSGSGKTTLINAIAGFCSINSGVILLNHKNLEKLPPHQRNIGVVFQDFALFPHLNVFDNIAFSLKIKKKSAFEIQTKVEQLLNIIGLNNYQKRHINELSGGEKQRIALARTLAAEPELILFDEPLSSIDEAFRFKLREMIKTIHQELKFTAIYVTHDHEEAFYLADDIGIMINGNLLSWGEKNELYNNPREIAVAKFLGYKNIFQGKIVCQNQEFFFVSNHLRLKINEKGYSSSIMYQQGNVQIIINPNLCFFSETALIENSFPITNCHYQCLGNYLYYQIYLNEVVLKEKITMNYHWENSLRNFTNLWLVIPVQAIKLYQYEDQ